MKNILRKIKLVRLFNYGKSFINWLDRGGYGPISLIALIFILILIREIYIWWKLFHT